MVPASRICNPMAHHHESLRIAVKQSAVWRRRPTAARRATTMTLAPAVARTAMTLRSSGRKARADHVHVRDATVPSRTGQTRYKHPGEVVAIVQPENQTREPMIAIDDGGVATGRTMRSEEHTSELQSPMYLV